jgi:uncharacterized protein YbcI
MRVSAAPGRGKNMLVGISERLSGGELNAALTSEVVRVHTAYLGRGPNRAFTFHHGNTVVTVMQEAMTKAEQRLAANGDGEAVLAMRRRFQMAMGDELKASVEELTGREVIAVMSDNHLNPDMAIEVFMLDVPMS